MIYKKLKRTWSQGFSNISAFTKEFPELSDIDNDEIICRLKALGWRFYTVDTQKVPWYIRITLPFAITLFLLMFLSLPLHFMITGRWKYKYSNKNFMVNWFRMLKLLKGIK